MSAKHFIFLLNHIFAPDFRITNLQQLQINKKKNIRFIGIASIINSWFCKIIHHAHLCIHKIKKIKKKTNLQRKNT